MANISIDSGQTYRFARVQNNTIILGSDNHSHAERTIGNKLIVSGANVPTDAVDIFVNTSGYARIQRPAAGTNSSMFTIANTSTDGYCFMRFNARNDYAMGTFSDDALTGDQGDFQLRDSTALATSPRTDGSVCFAFTRDKEFFLPNIDSATGTHFLKWDSSTREVTYASSTQKIKKNIISPPSKVYDNILALQPRYFEMKNPKDAGKQFLSFIAEETAAVSPQFATYGPDWAYDDTGFQKEEEMLSDKLVPMDIDDRAIIAALVGKMQQLEQRLQQLESQ
jgi:hypothetical protein